MHLLEFIQRESKQSYKAILLIALISGLANTLLVLLVNYATEAMVNGESLTHLLMVYVIAMTLFLQTQWLAFSRSIALVEIALYSRRRRLTRKIRQLEFAYVEETGSARLYRRLIQNDALVSHAVPQLVNAFQLLTLMVFSFCYLALLSPLTFLFTLSALIAGVMFFAYRSRQMSAAMAQVKRKEDGYFRSIAELIEGFKEIKINREKGNDLVEHILTASAEAEAIKVKVHNKEAQMWGFGRLFVYSVLPIVLFILPGLSQDPAHHLFKITALLLFLMGPITVISGMFPILTRVQEALDDFSSLEQDMDASMERSQPVRESHLDLSGFRQLVVEDLHFHFVNERESFAVGPCDQTFQRGELVFIIGGNGSGKSTFLKLLTGLYTPQQGHIRVDDTVIGLDSQAAYRALFAVVFTDFHLFDRFYGIADLDPALVDAWIERMGLKGKAGYERGGFTTRDLSTGQRKRLAFIVAMLERKPILILDEFAADQDPPFRRYFYDTILPELKASGTTVIAVTHDDHYFHVADRILKMDEGRFVASGC